MPTRRLLASLSSELGCDLGLPPALTGALDLDLDPAGRGAVTWDTFFELVQRKTATIVRPIRKQLLCF